MAYKNVRFPPQISYGATGGPSYSSDIVVVASGAEKRQQNWSLPLYKFEAAHGLKTQSELNTLIAFFRLMKGRIHSFRFKNWSEFQIFQSTSAFNNNVALTGDKVLQCYRKYQYESEEIEFVKTTKIVDGTFKLYKNGSQISSFTLDNNTGIVTLTTALATLNITAITNAANGVVTTATNHGLTTGDKILLSGIGGMTQLNGATATVNVISATTFQIGINTTSYSTYTTGGIVEKFYQPADIFTFECEFDFHCRFDTDNMFASIDNYQVYSWGQIPLVEVRE